MLKPPNSILNHLFYNRRYPNTLSNIFIFDSTMSSLTTHPMQHRHLCDTYFILVLILNRLTFYLVKHRRFHRSLVKKFLQFEWKIYVT